jgi:O-antigen/teichoic acid export membrane protein
MRYFSPEDYGAISISVIIIHFITMVASAGMMSALHRLYFSVDIEKRKVLSGTTYFWHIVVGLLFFSIFLIFPQQLSVIFSIDKSYMNLMPLLGIYFLFNFLLEIPFNLLRLEQKSTPYVAFSLLRFFIDFISKIIFILIYDRGVVGYFESGVISVILTFVFIYIGTSKYVSYKINKTYLYDLLKLGLPFIPAGFAAWGVTVSDRLLLNHFHGDYYVGIFSVGLKFASVFSIFLFTPMSTYLTLVVFKYSEKHSVEETKIFFRKMFRVLFISGGIVYLVISLASVDVINIFVNKLGSNRDYLSSILIIPLLTLVPLLKFFSFPLSYALLIVKKPKYIMYSILIGFVINLVLNLLLIPKFYIIGAAIATIVAFIGQFLIFYYFANNFYRIEYKLSSIVLIFIIMVPIVAIIFNIHFSSIWTGLFFRPIIGVIIFLLLCWYATDLLTESQKKLVIFSKNILSEFK